MLVRLDANTDVAVPGTLKGKRGGISILEFPLRDSRIVETCHYGEEIIILDGKPGEAGLIFLLIETAKGIRGWISDQYLGNPDPNEN